ncbi:MAG TPA: VanW family protein [Acidimicrobiales bacterium]|nr:VanW family protein [Acidimicrobiales bacterium]
MVWAAALTPVVAVLLIVAAWAIDTGAAGGEVLRNVTIAGRDLGGMDTTDLLEHLEEVDGGMAERPIRISTPDASYETTAGAIGLAVVPRATAEDVLDEGRTEPLPLRPLTWLAGFVQPREVDVRYEVDVERARTTIQELEGDSLIAPREPTIESIDGDPYRPVPGQAGTGIDPAVLARALVAAADDTDPDEPVDVSVRQSELAPRLDDSVAATAAEAANELTARTISITAGERTFQLVPRELRALAEVRVGEDDITVGLPTEGVLGVLEQELSDLEVEPRSASFTVSGGRPVLQPAVTGLDCCSEEAAEAVQDAFAGGTTDVQVQLTETEPDLTTEEAEALGIVEEVGSPDAFGPTTRHQCCEGRVENIHRIADIVRGVVIRPGETFSVNGYVGRRTRERGFVAAGVIYNGEFTEDVGGGVSQFATTLFNAALYAGLDFGEYQSHSIYISRYPRGHEATISYPNPDLQIVNDSQYGVLIWPEYTDTSITVRLYSTRHIDVTVGEPRPSAQGNCTRWTTPRTRRYPDGRVEEDSVGATYRPGEGVRC